MRYLDPKADLTFKRVFGQLLMHFRQTFAQQPRSQKRTDQ